MPATIASIPPLWGQNYELGYIGFTYTQSSFISRGIAFFERWDRMGEIPVSHALIVTGERECVEALPRGVSQTDLGRYFEDEKILIFFRKPRYYSFELGSGIAEYAKAQIGKKYGTMLLLAHAFRGSIAGKIINRLTWDLPNKFLSRILDSKRQQICSELAASALNSQPQLKGLGCLRNPSRLINPQMLFEDDAIFERWKARA